MWLRASIVLAFAVGLILVQLFASATASQRFGDAPTTDDVTEAILGRSVSAQDDNDNNTNDNDDNGDDGDNGEGDGDNGDGDGDNGDGDGDNDDVDGDNGDGDGDNGDADGDNGDGDGDDNDNEDDGDDNENTDEDVDDNDNEGEAVPGIEAPPIVIEPVETPTPTPIPVTPTPTPYPTRTPTPVPEPTTEDQAVTTGSDLQLALTGDRVVVQVFSTTPAGIVLTLRLVDPATHPGAPGTQVGDLIFRIEATDLAGAPLAALPADVNLSVRYADEDLAGLDDSGVTLARFDPAANQWTAAPQQLSDPGTNFVAASISDLGVYAVYVP